VLGSFLYFAFFSYLFVIDFFLFSHQRGDFLLFYVGTLPFLEHGLRRIYARVNNCPERVLTANPDVFYTTLDEILARDTEEGSPNLTIAELGFPTAELLYDLFMLQTGPRLRDRISHGEANKGTFRQNIADVYLLLLVSVALRFEVDPSTPAINSVEVSVEEKALLKRVAQLAGSYRSVYHPLSLLRASSAQKFTTLLTTAAFLKEHSDLPDDDYDEDDNDGEGNEEVFVFHFVFAPGLQFSHELFFSQPEPVAPTLACSGEVPHQQNARPFFCR